MNDQLDYNRLQQFIKLDLFARQVVEGFIVGLHKSPFHGFSVEFAEHRLYNSGESVKHVDWKLFGRTDKLFVKKYEEDTNLRCQVIIDNSSSMYYPAKKEVNPEKPSKIVFSVYAAASIIHLLKKQRDAFGLSLFSDEIELHTNCKSSSVHQKYLYGHLENLLKPFSEKKKTFAADALHEIADKIHKRSLVVIFSDMFENRHNGKELLSSLQHLKHNKHEVILFHVVDKSKEIDFDFDNRPYKFIDLETNEELKIVPGEVRDEYRKSVEAFRKELILKCGQYKIDFVEADINLGLEQILLPYLLKREKLY
ncbi:MAG: DUF58 domain-containing protein [Desulfobacula sp.]|nr:DUF58 domain-containing protein [Desulfobacula sp.]